jgi:type IV pilus assembly protein PilW
MAATFPCISSFQTGTDVLMIKRVKGDSTTSPSTEKIYVYTNRSNGEFNTGHHTLDTANGEQAWEYYVHLYYLEDGILKKKYLTWDDSNNKFIMDTTELAEGIEKFHVMFGIDSDDDGAMDYYTSSPSNADLDGVISARIYVLAKSSKEVNGYTNSKTYSLGDITISGGNDGYYRRVFSTSVILRNPLIINTIANS